MSNTFLATFVPALFLFNHCWPNVVCEVTLYFKKMYSYHKAFLIVVGFVLGTSGANAQQTDTLPSAELQEVVVQAYEQGRRLRDVPAAVQVIGQGALSRFAPLSLVAAVNAAPGIRMEERSPGSYRFNIRGSSLRSPFGVRNVKVYYNDLPFTLPGGTTYLNNLGFYNVHQMEVIKGPGSSLYGAGTGGVLLLESMSPRASSGVEAAYTIRSFGTHQAQTALTTSSDNSLNRFQVQHQQSDGYRDHSALKRTVADWSGHFRLGEKSLLKTSFLYSNLEYKTPGALTEAEYKANAKAARPGSAAAAAAIRQQTLLAGASLEQELSPILKNKTVVYGAATQLTNPNLRGYDESLEPHTGARTIFSLQPQLASASLLLQAGAEVQAGWGAVTNSKNVGGRADSLRYSDAVKTTQALYFAQATMGLARWQITGGLSVNSLNIRYRRSQPQTAGNQTRNFNQELAGRLALLYRLEQVSFYSSISRGFSPPTLSELLPTGGAINTGLDPESGTNYDIGARGSAGRFSFDVNLFYFSLQNTIVQRRDAAGGDFYLNSGKTAQLGVESMLQYRLRQLPKNNSTAWLSATLFDFRYRDFKPLQNDFSGNKLPGIAPLTIASGIDWRVADWAFFANYMYSGSTPLNDANTATAKSFHLLGVQVQRTFALGAGSELRCFAGVENLLDQQYSLGNDLNAFGGRYYNAAPGRNYFGGLAVALFQKQ